MTISLSTNIITTPTTDSMYVEMKPTLEGIQNNMYLQCGHTDDKLCLYDLLYSIAGEVGIPKVTITIAPYPPNAIVNLKIIK